VGWLLLTRVCCDILICSPVRGNRDISCVLLRTGEVTAIYSQPELYSEFYFESEKG
jgi:hypothetical protein